jgi:hypothetical protein
VLLVSISGDDLAHALAALGYVVTRQTGSHMRHDALRVGTVAAILSDVAEHRGDLLGLTVAWLSLAVA